MPEVCKGNGYETENKELWKWLMMLADVNDDDVKRLVVEDPEKAEIIEELHGISKSKEELMKMLSEKYAAATRSSEMVYAKREAMREGRREGETIGKDEKIIELIMNNHQEFSADAAAKVFMCDRVMVDEVYRLLDTREGDISIEEIRQKLVEGGFIEEPTFETV